ncbi:MAG: thiol reductant ABC exporter subunit CydD [Arachnia propionica]|nr:MAG: thiol reductant ABC exporter subunit CydD [Arachnia propionica]
MAGPVHPRLAKRAGATRNYLVASVLVGVATAVLMIWQAALLAEGIATVFDQHRLPDNWVWLLVALSGVFLGRAVLGWGNSVLAHRSAAAVKSQLRRDLLAASVARPVTPAATSTSLVRLMTTGLDDLDGYFSKYLPQLGLAATVPFIVGFTVLLTDWPSAIIMAITLPLIPVFMALIGWTTEKATKRSFNTADRLANHFADLIAGLPTLQAFARARAQRRGVELSEEKYRGATMKVLYVSFLSALALELLATLSVAVIAVTVGFRLVYGEIDFQPALFVLVLAPEAFLPVRQVGVHFHDSVDGVAAADAAFEIIDAGEPHPGTKQLSGPSSLELRNVSYTYPGAAEPALQDFNLSVQPGEVVGIKGSSGGGKSTALRLAMGFLAADDGEVLVADTDLQQLDLASWHDRIAWVAQDPGMISGTVGDNVTLGHPAATDAQLTAALRDAGADFDLAKSVGDDGEGLSAGERRRVALARALLHIRHGHADLLLLDEPTAGLDADAEARVVRAVKDSGAGALIVSHRPSVLAAADRVVEVI